MPDQDTAYVFVDANTALHFKRPDQIDWLRLTKAKEVVLVAAPILLRELENQKVVNTSRKLRERANAYVKWLHKFAVDPKTEVRTSVRWLFLAHEPQIDFVAERLSTNIHDDHLIASALGHMRDGHTHVFVATADLGLTVKLRARGISVLTLSDDLRLPIEADPLEQENSALKQQLARLHARMPKLSVAFDNGEQHIALKRVRLKADGIPSLARVRSEHMFMARPGQPRASGSVPFPLADLENLTSQFGVSGDRIDTYNRDLERYFSEYEDYLARHAAWREAVSLHNVVKLVIANDGTAPSSNIDLDLDFSDGVVPVDEDDFPKEPEPPKPPRRPQGIMDLHLGGDYVSPLLGPHLQQLVNPDYDGMPFVEGGTVRISYAALKHGFSVTSKGFIVRCADQSLTSFQIGYRLSADELPDAIEGQLHVRLCAEDA